MSLFGKPNPAIRLAQWYKAHCNGDWEHQYGVKIETIDNPGWHIEINLEGTELLDVPFKDIRTGTLAEKWSETEAPWIIMKKKDKKIDAACSPSQLNTVLTLFNDWARKNGGKFG